MEILVLAPAASIREQHNDRKMPNLVSPPGRADHRNSAEVQSFRTSMFAGVESYLSACGAGISPLGHL
jgi:hypothetical protein